KLIKAEISSLLVRGYDPDDIFILAPSVKSKSERNPIKRIANMLSEELKIPIFVPTNDDSALDKDILANKITFSSFHQAKGLERRAVFIIGFDESYFTYYAVNEPGNICPNALYVALTRAKEYLSIYHIDNKKFMNFIRTDKLSYYAQIRGNLHSVKKDIRFIPTTVAAIELTRHLASTILSDCMDLISYKNIREPGQSLSISNKVEQRNPFDDITFEDV